MISFSDIYISMKESSDVILKRLPTPSLSTATSNMTSPGLNGSTTIVSIDAKSNNSAITDQENNVFNSDRDSLNYPEHRDPRQSGCCSCSFQEKLISKTAAVIVFLLIAVILFFIFFIIGPQIK